MSEVKPGVVAIVQARGGSKGIPGKNIKMLGDFPLIAYSIAAGLQSPLVERVIMSTDSEEIAEVARQWGAEVPFLRPAEISGDLATDLELFTHALQWLADHENYRPELVVQLRPTSPLRPPNLIAEGVEKMLNDPFASSLRAVAPSAQTPYKMWRIFDLSLPMRPVLSENYYEPYNMPRQSLPPTYTHTGALDVIRWNTIMLQKSMTGDHILPLIIEAGYSVDIDTPDDWEGAEWRLQRLDLPYVKPIP